MSTLNNTLKGTENNDTDPGNSLLEEGFSEEANISQEKYLKKFKNSELDQKSILSSYQSLATLSNNCVIHPDEILQFFCFDNSTLLCSECLVKGRHSGSDVANLKKAVERLKLKFNELAKESSVKVEACKLLEKELEEQQSKIIETFLGYKEEVRQRMSEIRETINLKEEELLRKIEEVQEEELNVMNNSGTSLLNYKEGIESVANAVKDRYKNLDDISFCRFYLSKADAFKENLNDEICVRIQRVKKVVEQHQSQEELIFNRVKEEIKKLKSLIQEIGSKIGTSKLEVNSPLIEALENGYKKSLYVQPFLPLPKEDTGSNNSITQKEIITSQILSQVQSRRQSSRNPSKSSDVNIETGKLSPKNESGPRSKLLVELRKELPKKETHLLKEPITFIGKPNNPPSHLYSSQFSKKPDTRDGRDGKSPNRSPRHELRSKLLGELRREQIKIEPPTGPLIGRHNSPPASLYSSQISKLSESRDNLYSSKYSLLDSNPKHTTPFRSESSPRKNLINSIFSPKSVKPRSPKRLLDSSTGQVSSFLTDSYSRGEKMVSPPKRVPGSEGVSNFETGPGKKGHKKTASLNIYENSLKSKLKELNSQFLK